MINTKQGVWLLGILGLIMVILVCILIFIPAKKIPAGTEGLQIDSMFVNQEIFSPLVITGTVSGNGWTGFEGQTGVVKLLDGKGNELALGLLNATTPWTSLPTRFEATLSFQSEIDQLGSLVFINENASGLPERDRKYVLPVKLPKSDNLKLEIFFGNQLLSSSGEQDECKRVYKTTRIVNKTSAVAKTAIEELLNGPTNIEKSQGYFTSIPTGSKLNSISIVDGQVKVDFNEVTESGGGSCSMVARVAQITQTLLQFPTITSVKISINGRTEDIFQP